MRCVVRFLDVVRKDLEEFSDELAGHSPGMDVTALRDFLIQELKNLLAHSAGQPPGAYRLYDDIFELEYVRGRV